MLKYFAFALACLGAVACVSVAAADTAVERGKYLVAVTGCGDCHTPGYFLGRPDMTKFLAGSDVSFAVPGLGVSVAPNLTPDQDTGRRERVLSRSSSQYDGAYPTGLDALVFQLVLET